MGTTKPTSAGRRSGDRRATHDAAWLVAALLVAAAVRLTFAAHDAGLTMDSANYVRMSEALGEGRRFLAPAHYGYPALVALASRALPGRELPARAVSFVASLALMAVAWALARMRLGPRASAFAAGLVALHPLLAVYGVAIMTEATFLALAFAALLLVERDRPAWGGGLAGLACWVRPEGVLIGLGAALSRASRPNRAALVLAGLAIAAAPYVAFERWERGAWALSPKTSQFHPPAANWRAEESHVPAAGGAPGAGPAPEPALPHAARWDAASLATDYPPALRRHLAGVLACWPWPLLALSLAGLARRRGALLSPLLVLAALPLVDVPDDPRLVLVLVPALAVYAAEGATLAVARVTGGFAAAWAKRACLAALAALSLTGIALAWRGPAGAIAIGFDDGPMLELRAAGEWIGGHGTPADRVMDRKSYVPFFAGMEHVQLPDDDYETIIGYAQRAGVRWLVVEQYVVLAFRPQLAPLVADRAFRARETRLRRAFVTHGEPGSGVAVFEVLPGTPTVRSAGSGQGP